MEVSQSLEYADEKTIQGSTTSHGFVALVDNDILSYVLVPDAVRNVVTMCQF